MPYHWTETPKGPLVLRLTAHRSLPRRGFAGVILFTAAMLSLPLLGLLGTVQLWLMLPPMAVALWALWFALRRSYRDGLVHEELGRVGETLTLTHVPVKGAPQSWECNIYWVRATLYDKGGPVDHYLTLTGNGREVELGRFLSEDERKALYVEIQRYLATA